MAEKKDQNLNSRIKEEHEKKKRSHGTRVGWENGTRPSAGFTDNWDPNYPAGVQPIIETFETLKPLDYRMKMRAVFIQQGLLKALKGKQGLPDTMSDDEK
ncbi:hypothetical protein RJ640_006978 [Escallonia rubra]|uniref:Uncharacterized protein n=1 Tax=Escallonia rubra TaxID=112253 RepID=A0AA88R342_9ASTE|nr:hypothetical protein RJ640_006978 [Escallonia rubra]